MLKNALITLFISLNVLIWATGCAEKKTRIWIEPPAGYESNQKLGKKLYYQVEDIQSGKKENLWIPIDQTPENLVLENQKGSGKIEAELALATKADKQIRDGKIGEGTSNSPPSLSYLLGMEEIENLYQKQKYTEALVRIAPLIEQYPQQSRLFVMQGTLYRKIGEKMMAYQAYKQAMKLDRKNPVIEEAVLRLQDELGENL